MKSFLVIGLGRFGTSLACELCALGHEVMAVDLREERVQEVAGSVTHAAAGDARVRSRLDLADQLWEPGTLTVLWCPQGTTWAPAPSSSST